MAQALLNAKAGILEVIEYYLSIPQIRRDWAYLSPSAGRHIGAAWVIPSEWLDDYLPVYRLEAQRLADEIGGADLSAQVRADIVGMAVDDGLHERVIRAALGAAVARVEARHQAGLPALDADIAALRAALPDDADGRSSVLPLSIEVDEAALGSLDHYLETVGPRLVEVPACIVPRLGQATFVGALGDSPEQTDALIAGWQAIMARLEGVGDAALRLVPYVALMPEAEGAALGARLDAIVAALDARRESIIAVESFIDARARCPAVHLSADPMGPMLEVLQDGDWQDIRDVIGFVGVTDPARDPLENRLREGLGFGGIAGGIERSRVRGTMFLPDEVPNLEAMNQRLGGALAPLQ